MNSPRTQSTPDERPRNGLIRHLSGDDFRLVAPHLEYGAGSLGEVLYYAGDKVKTVNFPCGSSLVSFLVAVENGREVETILIGQEGAIGGIISGGSLPAYSRSVVKIGGPLVRLPVRKLEEAQAQSSSIKEVFARYADCLLGQLLQSTACNAAHSIEQPAAKWIIIAMEHVGTDHGPLTQEQLAGVLGVRRSYASRVMQTFRAEGVLETQRGTILVRDLAALHRKSCQCNDWVKKHFDEALPGVYPNANPALYDETQHF